MEFDKWTKVIILLEDFSAHPILNRLISAQLSADSIQLSKFQRSIRLMLSTVSRTFFHGHYLDTQATAQVDPRVLDAMLPYEIFAHGNAHSKQHGFGIEAKAAV